MAATEQRIEHRPVTCYFSSVKEAEKFLLQHPTTAAIHKVAPKLFAQITTLFAQNNKMIPLLRAELRGYMILWFHFDAEESRCHTCEELVGLVQSCYEKFYKVMEDFPKIQIAPPATKLKTSTEAANK